MAVTVVMWVNNISNSFVDLGFDLAIHIKTAEKLLLLQKGYSWIVRQEMDAEGQAGKCKRTVGKVGMLL